MELNLGVTLEFPHWGERLLLFNVMLYGIMRNNDF